MDYLWTPWRYAYLQTTGEAPGERKPCIFCELPKLTDEHARIAFRGKSCFIVLNSFPYTSGHVMIVPFAHLDTLSKLPEETARELMALSQRVESALGKIYSPDGINLGMNLGRAAGAGIAGHCHMHVLPRWVGDANFMTTVGESRVLPETLDETWKKMRAALL